MNKINDLLINYITSANILNILFSQEKYLSFIATTQKRMKRRLANQHTGQFCSKAQPIIENMTKEYYNSGRIDMNAIGELMDELEVIESLTQEKCQCRKAIAVIIEAANLQRWLDILFTQHESKFRKYSINIPQQYFTIKSQVFQLIQNLQQKMLFTTYQKQSKLQENKNQGRKRVRYFRNRHVLKQNSYQISKNKGQDMNQIAFKRQSNPEVCEQQY